MPYHIHMNNRASPRHSRGPEFIAGLAQVFQVPILSFFMIFIIAFALFLPAGFYVFRNNINALDSVWNQSAEIQLYLKKNVTQKMALDLETKLKSNPQVMDLKLISADDGLKDFARHTGFGEILLGVKGNPLPSVIIIYPKLRFLSESHIKALVDSLKELPEVEATKIDMDWVGQSYHLLTLFEKLSSILIVLLNVGAMLIISFLAYAAPQIIANKIETSKRALQYQCFWCGLIGGLMAVTLVHFILRLLEKSDFILQGLGLPISIQFVLVAALLMFFISRYSVRS